MAVAGKSQCLAIIELKYVSYDTTSYYAGSHLANVRFWTSRTSRILARDGLSAGDPNRT